MTATTTLDALDRLAGVVHATTSALQDAPASAATIRPRVRTSLVAGTPTRVDVTAGRHGFAIDEPATLGGDDTGANPVEHLLAALGACQVISYQVWAAKLGLTLDGITVDLTGDLDVRGFFGVDEQVRPGFTTIHVDAHLTGPETADAYRELTALVDRHCPVLDVLTAGVQVTSTVTHHP